MIDRASYRRQSEDTAAERGRGLSGTVHVEFDVLDAFQNLSALAHYTGYLRGQAHSMLEQRRALGISKPGEGEEMYAIAIAQCERATRAIDKALGWNGTPDPMGPREGESESELRAAWGDR
jgi:hypothetical protein